ncbi:hypothetical protein GCM10010452_83750 [Crossiella cryophila]
MAVLLAWAPGPLTGHPDRAPGLRHPDCAPDSLAAGLGCAPDPLTARLDFAPAPLPRARTARPPPSTGRPLLGRCPPVPQSPPAGAIALALARNGNAEYAAAYAPAS